MKDTTQAILNWQATVSRDIPNRAPVTRLLGPGHAQYMDRNGYVVETRDEDLVLGIREKQCQAAAWYEENLDRCKAVSASVLYSARKAYIASAMARDRRVTIRRRKTSILAWLVSRYAVTLHELFLWEPGCAPVTTDWHTCSSFGYFAIHAASYLSLQARNSAVEATAGLEDIEDFAWRFREHVENLSSDRSQYLLVNHALTYTMDNVGNGVYRRYLGKVTVDSLREALGEDAVAHEPVPTARMYNGLEHVDPSGFLVEPGKLAEFLTDRTRTDVSVILD